MPLSFFMLVLLPILPSSLEEILSSNSKVTQVSVLPQYFVASVTSLITGILALGLVACVCIWNKLWAVPCRDHMLFLPGPPPTLNLLAQYLEHMGHAVQIGDEGKSKYNSVWHFITLLSEMNPYSNYKRIICLEYISTLNQNYKTYMLTCDPFK